MFVDSALVSGNGALERFKIGNLRSSASAAVSDAMPSTHAGPTFQTSDNYLTGFIGSDHHYPVGRLKQPLVPGSFKVTCSGQPSQPPSTNKKHPISFSTPIKIWRRFGGGTIWWWNIIEQQKTKCVSFDTDKFSHKIFQTSDVSEHEFAKTQMSRPTKPK